jgi:putative SOS response-associated peptidase YedK
MPVIVAPEDYETWLDPDLHEADWLTPLLTPYPSEALEAYPVSRFVNNPSNNDERCLEPAA